MATIPLEMLCFCSDGFDPICCFVQRGTMPSETSQEAGRTLRIYVMSIPLSEEQPGKPHEKR